MNRPTCDKKIVVYYEVLRAKVREIEAICNKYGIEYAMMFRTDELDDEAENDQHCEECGRPPQGQMTSYGISVELSKETAVNFIEMLCRRQRRAQL